MTFCNTSLVHLSVLDDIYVPFNEILYELQSIHFCSQFVMHNMLAECAHIYHMAHCLLFEFLNKS